MKNNKMIIKKIIKYWCAGELIIMYVYGGFLLYHPDKYNITFDLIGTLNLLSLMLFIAVSYLIICLSILNAYLYIRDKLRKK